MPLYTYPFISIEKNRETTPCVLLTYILLRVLREDKIVNNNLWEMCATAKNICSNYMYGFLRVHNALASQNPNIIFNT